jgi:RNA polymerase sigma factor (sigma-70 family)
VDDITRWAKTIKEALNRYAKKLPTDVREDFEQEVYLKLWKISETIVKIQSEQGEVAVKNYVYGVCVNRVKDLVKAEKKSTNVFDCSEDEAAYEPSDGEEDIKPAHGISNHELDAAIKQLSREEQHVIRSQFFQGHTWKEMISSLDRSRGSVWEVRDSALRNLKQILESGK